MLISTTNVIEGKPVQRYLGLVTGEAIMGTNIFRDIMARVRDVVGGRSGTYEKALQEGRDAAVQAVSERARQLGADAVIGVDLDYETVGEGMLMVTVSGTAVKLT